LANRKPNVSEKDLILPSFESYLKNVNMNIFFFGGKGAIGSVSKKVADNRELKA
jgi:glutamate dehydrogenase/leucine dehydrogenase